MRILIILVLIVTQVVFAKPMIVIQNWISNNAKVLFTEVHESQLPMVDVLVAFDAGSARDGDAFGLAAFTSAMLSSGAKTLTADQVAEKFEQIGAQFSAYTSRDITGVSLRCLTKDGTLDDALQTFIDVLTTPAFSQSEFNRVKNQIITEIEENKQNPAFVASEEFFKQLYSNPAYDNPLHNHPYSHSSSGTRATVERLSSTDLAKFHQDYYIAQNAIIVIVGDVTLQQAKDIANKITAELPKGAKAAAPLPEVVKNLNAKTYHVPFDSQQTNVLIGQIGIARNNKDYLPLYVGNYILGGSSLSSELYREVREKNGFVYNIDSIFSAFIKPGPFQIKFSSSNEKSQEAMTVTMQTLDKFIKNGPTEDSLQAAKEGLTAGFPLEFASNAAIRDKLTTLGFYNLSLDYFDTYVDKIRAITIEQVLDAFKQHIVVGNMVKVMVGKKLQSP